jgi:hypothetical protein
MLEGLALLVLGLGIAALAVCVLLWVFALVHSLVAWWLR